MEAVLKSSEVITVIACGGLSSRMGIDKLKLNYHGIPQWKYLKDCCEALELKTYISIRETQKSELGSENNYIFDESQFANHGPITGLLSAHKKFQTKSILFLGCDYPEIGKNEINDLINYSHLNSTTSYFNNYYEPLLAFYSNSDLKNLLSHFNQGNDSLSKFLKNIKAQKLIPKNISILKSVDTIEEYELIKQKISTN